MSLKTQLEKKIQAKTQEIAEFEAKIREARAYVQGLQDAVKMLPRDAADEQAAEQVLRKGSDMDRTRDLLRKVGKPLYIDEILKGIGKENTPSLRKSLSSSLNVYVGKGEIFIRTRPNTYGLVGMEENGSDNSTEDEELPDDFGIPEPETEKAGEVDDDEVPW
ncbi:MAG TPA: hypothetical protein VGP08_18180 [Pyrinomonadaceae bacterium]|jgi:hypothetical protein|nr:hypothetical protein [Pyrinomonadaceae bacterium]